MQILFRATAALLLGVFTMPALAVPENNTIEFSNCTLTAPGQPVTAPSRCGFLEVPENPEDPDGRKILVHVAVAGAGDQDAAEDPLFFLAGGPGQAATETWISIRSWLRKINRKRDIVLVDQRGTGQSNRLSCPSSKDIDLNAEIDFEEIAREASRCLDALDADPRYYTTTVAMQDINLVRQAMGYDKINIMGVSYGTRAAQVYLRQFPETVRTVTLDSVVPMQLALGQEHAPMLEQAVAKVLQDCATQSECNALFPLQQTELTALLQALRQNPSTLTITNPINGEDQETLLNGATLAVAVRFLSYSSETQALLPLLIHEALTTGDLERLASQAMLVMSGITEAISRGMELSVLCSEDYPFMNVNADYDNTLLGNVMLKAIEAQCDVWPRGVVPEGFHDPVVSDVPVLLVSGERDPVTPPHYAAQAAETFSNHVNLVAPGQAHSVLRNVCIHEIATAFIVAGTVDDLDTQCVESIEPSPFFTSLLGPNP